MLIGIIGAARQIENRDDFDQKVDRRRAAFVAGHYGLAVSELTSTTRAARVSWPRQLAIP